MSSTSWKLTHRCEYYKQVWLILSNSFTHMCLSLPAGVLILQQEMALVCDSVTT